MVICLQRGADLHMAQLMPLSLASVKSRLVLPSWYWLTRVVPDKGPLNGCVSWSRKERLVTSVTACGIFTTGIHRRMPFQTTTTLVTRCAFQLLGKET